MNRTRWFGSLLLSCLLVSLAGAATITIINGNVVRLDSPSPSTLSSAGNARIRYNPDAGIEASVGGGAFGALASDSSKLPLAGGTMTGQLVDTLNPASTGITDSTILANPAACGANEVLLGVAVASSRVAGLDCEGDLDARNGTFSGSVAGTTATFSGAAQLQSTLAVTGTTTAVAVNATGQLLSTLDPASTAITASTILANPATCAANEVLVGAAVNGTRKSGLDCEGDIDGRNLTLAGTITGVTSITASSSISGTSIFASTQFRATGDPASTTFTSGSIISNPSTCDLNEVLVGAGVGGTAKATLDCEGDIAGRNIAASGQLVGTLDPVDTTFANGAVLANPATCGSNEILLGAGVASAAKATFDCEGDGVVRQLAASGQVTAAGTQADAATASASLLVNPSGCFTGLSYLFDAAVSGASEFSVDCSGNAVAAGSVTAFNITATAAIAGVGITASGQIIGTKDPASTTFAQASILANPATCATDEILLGAGVNSVAKGTIDCEGDIVGVKGTFSGQVQSNSTNVLTAVTENWVAQPYGGNTATAPAANVPLAQFQTGALGATLKTLNVTTTYVGTAATGTGSIDVTDTAGTSKCALAYACNSASGAIATPSDCSSTALTANTLYQMRWKTQCGGSSSFIQIHTDAVVTIP